jgi:hypothetical protein
VIFEELSGFTRRVIRLLDDQSYMAFQIALVKNPELGKLIRQSGGLRKIRWALPGKGKSGGVRIIYYFWGRAEDRITLCEIYSKNEKETLTPGEIQSLRKQIEQT